MKSRIEKLFNGKNEGTAYLISNESNVKYMSGFTGEASYLILSDMGHAFMTDGRYDEQARQECPDFEVSKWHNPSRPDPETIIHYLKKFEVKALKFNEHSITFSQYTKLSNAIKDHNLTVDLIPMSGEVEALRAVKETEELDNLRKACQIADKALESLLPYIKVGVSELELVGQLEYFLKKYGAENISFDTIILSGVKTALPHGKPSAKLLESGDFLQVDFGALYKGYHSDMSRTFIIGELDDKKKLIYDMMLEATLAGTKALKDDIPASEPDDAVRQIITDEFIKYYYPGLGHGVGLDVHETPFMSQTSTARIQKGNVVTIEPGVYIPGYGGMRIEDTILVTEDGFEVLTHFPRALQVLG